MQHTPQPAPHLAPLVPLAPLLPVRLTRAAIPAAAGTAAAAGDRHRRLETPAAAVGRPVVGTPAAGAV